MQPYYAATAGDGPSFTTLERDAACDLCIVGGGITGLSAALHAAQSGLRVILLEAETIGWAASGRNAGYMTPYVDYDPRPIAAALGVERAQQYWQLAHEAVDYLPSLIARCGIDCDLKRGVLMAARNSTQLQKLSAGLEAFVKDYGMRNATILDRSTVRAVVGSNDYDGGLLHETLPILHPLKYVLGVARAARDAGATIHERTAVCGYEPGEQVMVRTVSGRCIRAQHVLLAANAYLGKLAPPLSTRFVAMYSNMIATEPLSPALARSVLPRDVAVLESQNATSCLYRLSGDSRLIFGGGGIFTGRNGRYVRPLLRKLMLKLFPQLACVRVDHVWGGWFGMTMLSDTPDIGRLADNIYYAQAIPVVWATLHGRLLSEALLGRPQGYNILSDIDIPPGPGGHLLSRSIRLAGDLVAAVRASFITAADGPSSSPGRHDPGAA